MLKRVCQARIEIDTNHRIRGKTHLNVQKFKTLSEYGSVLFDCLTELLLIFTEIIEKMSRSQAEGDWEKTVYRAFARFDGEMRKFLGLVDLPVSFKWLTIVREFALLFFNDDFAFRFHGQKVSDVHDQLVRKMRPTIKPVSACATKKFFENGDNCLLEVELNSL